MLRKEDICTCERDWNGNMIIRKSEICPKHGSK